MQLQSRLSQGAGGPHPQLGAAGTLMPGKAQGCRRRRRWRGSTGSSTRAGGGGRPSRKAVEGHRGQQEVRSWLPRAAHPTPEGLGPLCPLAIAHQRHSIVGTGTGHCGTISSGQGRARLKLEALNLN